MILVTGGAGFIGSHLVESLVREGEEVRVLDDLSSGHAHNLAEVADRIDLRRASVTDPAAVRDAMQGVTRVFHQAACPSVVQSLDQPLAVHEVNATGTLMVLEEASRAGVERVVLASSSSVYGLGGEAPGRETDPTWPLSPYAAQKLLGEHYARVYSETRGLSAVSLRYFNVFGPRQDPGSPYSGVISIFCDRSLRGEPSTIHGDGGQVRDFTYIDNVVDANRRAAEADVAGGSVFNVATGSSITVLELYRAIQEELGSGLEPCFGPARPGDIRISRADVRAAREQLGFQPRVAFREGLRQTLEWYRETVRS